MDPSIDRYMAYLCVCVSLCVSVYLDLPCNRYNICEWVCRVYSNLWISWLGHLIHLERAGFRSLLVNPITSFDCALLCTGGRVWVVEEHNTATTAVQLYTWIWLSGHRPSVMFKQIEQMNVACLDPGTGK